MLDDPLYEPILTREQALGILGALWDADTDPGSRLLVEIVAEIGYAAALTDDAIIRLAVRQRGEHDRLVLAAELRHKRGY